MNEKNSSLFTFFQSKYIGKDDYPPIRKSSHRMGRSRFEDWVVKEEAAGRNVLHQYFRLGDQNLYAVVVADSHSFRTRYR